MARIILIRCDRCGTEVKPGECIGWHEVSFDLLDEAGEIEGTGVPGPALCAECTKSLRFIVAHFQCGGGFDPLGPDEPSAIGSRESLVALLDTLSDAVVRQSFVDSTEVQAAVARARTAAGLPFGAPDIAPLIEPAPPPPPAPLGTMIGDGGEADFKICAAIIMERGYAVAKLGQRVYRWQYEGFEFYRTETSEAGAYDQLSSKDNVLCVYFRPSKPQRSIGFMQRMDYRSECDSVSLSQARAILEERSGLQGKAI